MEMVLIWPEISRFLQFNPANTERSDHWQEYSALKGLKYNGHNNSKIPALK